MYRYLYKNTGVTNGTSKVGPSPDWYDKILTRFFKEPGVGRPCPDILLMFIRDRPIQDMSRQDLVPT